MKLIIIHGSPAAGKLTVCRRLAELTGYKVFHNHVSIDCVKPVFEFGSQPFWRVLKLIREETFCRSCSFRHQPDTYFLLCEGAG